MNRFTPEYIYELLPAVYRQRDAEEGFPLRELVTILGEQARVLEGDIEGLYRNWFVETCDDWVVPYIGDLVGMQPTAAGRLKTRAEMANTLGYRRRKGTLAVVEQLARDVTGLPARAVEYFRLLATTQNLNHLLPDNLATPDLRDDEVLTRLGGPFERNTHLLEVRDIEHGTGRYNIPNIGVHLWRLFAYGIRRGMAREVEDSDGLHYTISPLGNDLPLFNRPGTLDSPFDMEIERNIPNKMLRHNLQEHLDELYGEDASIAVWVGEDLIAPNQVAVCHLADWHHGVPADKTVAIDPELGRLAFASESEADIRVLYYYGFSADIGGGPYDRSEVIRRSNEARIIVGVDSAQPIIEGVERFATIEAALAEWSSISADQRPSIIEIDDNSTYRAAIPDIEIPPLTSLTIRAANGRRPTLLLDDEWHVVGEADSELELNGLLIANQGMRVSGQLTKLRVRHCTFVPGRGLGETGQSLEPGETSLTIEANTTLVEIEHAIIGPIRAAVDCRTSIRDSIIDANSPSNLAYQGPGEDVMGAPVEFKRATIIGGVRAREILLASDTLFLGVIQVLRRQQGCLRFSHIPLDSVVPTRFHCQPVVPEGVTPQEREGLAMAVAPRFTSLRYGDPGYCQLASNAPEEIRRGGKDESEMGAFALLKQPLREASLRVRLDEYLRLGMRAGIFYVT